MTAFATQHFLPAVGDNIEFFPWHIHGKYSGGCITDSQACALVAYPVCIGDFDTRGGTVPGKDAVMVWIGLGHIWEQSIVRGITVEFCEL